MDTPKPPTAIAAPKRGAPKGNQNASRNGGRISRLVIGELPKPLRRQKSNLLKYRRDLETEVWEAKGSVSATDAHLIHEAVIATQHECICRWLLRTRLEDMSTADVTRCSEQILKSTSVRNRAIERIGLDRAQSRMPWDIDATATATEADDDQQ